MKKPFLMSLACLSLIACSNEEFMSPVDNGEEVVSTNELRTEIEAIAIATDALNEFYPATSRSVRDMSQISVVTLGNATSRSGEITNPLYVVNFGEDNGYAIISANKGVEPLLAVTESGSITSLDEIDNPGLDIFVAGAMRLEKDTTALVPIPGIGGLEPVDIWRNDTVFHVNTKVDPRITVNWGQDYPEGLLCPNSISGCIPTAGAQALSFFEYPEILQLTYPERTANEIVLDWKNMKNGIFSTNFWRPNGQYDIQLASLCREIGYKSNAIYNPLSTSASMDKLNQYLKNLLPSNRFIVSNTYSINPATNTALGNGIIIIGADGKKYNAETGSLDLPCKHAWVIDGYIYKQYTVYVYYHKENSPIEILERQFDKEDLYSHVNWGSNGSNNGYFYNNAFRTSSYFFNENFYYFTIQTK